MYKFNFTQDLDYKENILMNSPDKNRIEDFYINEFIKQKTKSVLYIGEIPLSMCKEILKYNYYGLSINNCDKALNWLENRKKVDVPLPNLIICDACLSDKELTIFFEKLATDPVFNAIPRVLFSNDYQNWNKLRAIQLKADDFYHSFSNIQNLIDRMDYLTLLRKNGSNLNTLGSGNNLFIKSPKMSYQASILKRLFDIIFSGTALILLSPIFFLIAVIIKFESKGPVLYISKRAGSGYKIFNFYKFRTMRKGSDLEIKRLMEHSQYAQTNTEDKSVFFKMRNDPRITFSGKFLRNTSLDELPQLLNVLKGDMSIVGNRPLPLYEAASITKDQWARRFSAPAGITGLWQVTKRGQKGMSVSDRINLDILYSKKNSFGFDLLIILKTFPALFQKENV